MRRGIVGGDCVGWVDLSRDEDYIDLLSFHESKKQCVLRTITSKLDKSIHNLLTAKFSRSYLWCERLIFQLSAGIIISFWAEFAPTAHLGPIAPTID